MICHLIDSRRDIAYKPSGRPAQIPVICSRDILTPNPEETWTSVVALVTCPDCKSRVQESRADWRRLLTPKPAPAPAMIYLSGAVRPELVGKRRDLGFILTPQMGNKPDLSAMAWGADNGCFAHPERFDGDKYLAWLAARPAATCLFATAPDVVGDAAKTLERSLPFLPRIRALGYPAALCAQDGLEDLEVPWDAFDVLFIGGSTAWKLSAAAADLVAQAKARGKWVHMGRVNSERRLRYAEAIGCDSADGTFLAFGPKINLPRLEGWLDRLLQAPRLQPAGALA